MNFVLILAVVASFGNYANGIRSTVQSGISETLASSVNVYVMTGVVTATSHDCFFVQQGGERVKILSADERNPGEAVIVRGMPVIKGGRVSLTVKSVDVIGKSKLPAPRPVSMDDLVSARVSQGGVNWLRVAVAGRAIGRTEGGFALSVDGVPVTVELSPLPSELEDCADTHPKVVVYGVLEQVLDPASLFGGDDEVMGIRLYADATGAVTIVPDLLYSARRRDGFVRRLLLGIVPVMALLIAGFVVALFRQRRRIFRDRTIMAERKRMADDLHDTIEQHLVGAKMLVQLGRTQQAMDVLARAKQEIRDIVWGVKNDDMMRLSPAEMLRKLAHDETAKGICRVDTGLDRGLPSSLDASKMRDLSLIVREAIGNAVKHGNAKRIAISSDALPNGDWRLRIANDGVPFDPSTVSGAAEGHFGLEGMRERARRLGATLMFEPRKAGMVISITCA